MDIEKNSNYKTLCENILLFAKSSETSERYEHSLSVANTALSLCERFNLDKDAAYVSGISHDICKDMKSDKILELAMQDKKEISELEMKKPSLLHGRAASVILSKEFGIIDKDVLEAVSLHTFGGENMCDIAKVIYIADKIEPRRKHITSEYYKQFENSSLNDILKIVIKEGIDYLKERNLEVASVTIKLLKSLDKLK